jgi:hypothetical protein
MAEKLFRAGGATADLVAQMPAEYIAQALEIPEDEAAIILSKVAPADAAPDITAVKEEAPAEEPAAEEPAAEDETKASEGAEA